MIKAVAPPSNSEDSDPPPRGQLHCRPGGPTLSNEWLDAHALTAERATAMLRDLKSTPPDCEPLDASNPDSVDAAAAAAADLNAKSLALLEFVCGDPKLQRARTAQPLSSPPPSPNVSTTLAEASATSPSSPSSPSPPSTSVSSCLTFPA